MAVSSLKGCWSKLSARIRDYIDVVDSYYRPTDEVDHHPAAASDDVGGHRTHRCGRKDCPMDSYIHLGPSSVNKDKRANSNAKSGHRHHHDQSCLSVERTSRLPEQQHAIAPVSSRKQNCLSLGYTKRKTAQGQVYFVDLYGHKYWHDPSVPKELLNASLDLDSLVGGLSNNWEVKQTSSGRTYFINHTKKTTQFTDPRLIAYKDELLSYLRRVAARHEVSTDPNSNSVSNERSTDSPPIPLTTSSRSAQQTITSVSGRDCNNLCGNQHSSQKRNSAITPSNQLNHSSRHNHSLAVNISSQHNDTILSGTLDSRNKQYHKNLLRGSHHNLNSTTGAGHSNTFTGPVPTWFKPLMLNGTRKQQQQHTTNNDRSTNNCHNNTSSTTNTSTSHHQQVNSSLFNSHNNNNSHYSATNNCHISTPNNNHSIPSFESYKSHHQDAKNKELFDKISILRQELLKQQVLSHPCRIDVSRKRIFEESFRAVSQMQPRDLKKRLLVKFRGEEGLDYGGVAREWFYLLSREILNPVHGLFQYTSDDIYNLQINPDSGIVYREHLSYLNFCGRIIGMAVFHGHFIEGHFTLPFYKMLLRKPITLSDIEYVDSELFRSLCWILDNDITDIIDTTFLVQHNAFGQLQEHELKENGRNIVVTEANKHEYVSLYVNYRCRRGIESQFEALQRGFYELVSPSLVENFDERELELLIGGLSKIDIEDWRLHTKLKNCTVETPLVIWFWDIVRSYDEDKRARLLQFVTGSPRVPIQGFKALQGVNSELRLFTIHLIKNANTDNLPKSHTCFNRIDLPPYETYDKLRDKLTQAIEETMGFAMQ